MQLARARFAGHESFTFRHTWLTKGVVGCAQDPALFRRDDALVTLGVGKNMVEAIRYWCQATRLLEEDPRERGALHASALAARLFLEDGGWDPYLEDSASLWLIHWLLATNPAWATTCYYAFNELTGLEFSRPSLEHALTALAKQQLNLHANAATIKRDVGVFVRTYLGSEGAKAAAFEDSLDCPLVELGLIYAEPTRQTYAFARGPKDSLPDAVVLFALADYVRQHKDQSTYAFDDLAYQPGSPGRVFKLDEAALAERLEHLERLTGHSWQLSETTGYRQMIVTGEVDPLRALDAYYTHGAGGDAHD